MTRVKDKVTGKDANFPKPTHDIDQLLMELYDKAVHGELPKRNYDKENDLAVYVSCVERFGHLASIMNAYPKTMTLEQVKQSIEYQLEKYRKLVIGQ